MSLKFLSSILILSITLLIQSTFAPQSRSDWTLSKAGAWGAPTQRKPYIGGKYTGQVRAHDADNLKASNPGSNDSSKNTNPLGSRKN